MSTSKPCQFLSSIRTIHTTSLLICFTLRFPTLLSPNYRFVMRGLCVHPALFVSHSPSFTGERRPGTLGQMPAATTSRMERTTRRRSRGRPAPSRIRGVQRSMRGKTTTCMMKKTAAETRRRSCPRAILSRFVIVILLTVICQACHMFVRTMHCCTALI